VHGLSIPLGKLGFYIPRTFSRAISTENESNSGFHTQTSAAPIRQSDISAPTNIHRIGRSFVQCETSTNASRSGSKKNSAHATPGGASPVGPGTPDLKPAGTLSDEAVELPFLGLIGAAGEQELGKDRVTGPAGRSIRFPDEQPHGTANAERDV